MGAAPCICMQPVPVEVQQACLGRRGVASLRCTERLHGSPAPCHTYASLCVCLPDNPDDCEDAEYILQAGADHCAWHCRACSASFMHNCMHLHARALAPQRAHQAGPRRPAAGPWGRVRCVHPGGRQRLGRHVWTCPSETMPCRSTGGALTRQRRAWAAPHPPWRRWRRLARFALPLLRAAALHPCTNHAAGRPWLWCAIAAAQPTGCSDPALAPSCCCRSCAGRGRSSSTTGRTAASWRRATPREKSRWPVSGGGYLRLRCAAAPLPGCEQLCCAGTAAGWAELACRHGAACLRLAAWHCAACRGDHHAERGRAVCQQQVSRGRA